MSRGGGGALDLHIVTTAQVKFRLRRVGERDDAGDRETGGWERQRQIDRGGGTERQKQAGTSYLPPPPALPDRQTDREKRTVEMNSEAN